VRGIVERAAASASPRPVPSTLLAPIDGETELWAAGVTYRRPEAARIEESATPDIYARPELNRGFDDLVQYLFIEDDFPDGVIGSTGTALVPDRPFTLLPGDVVEIEIDHLGLLRNPVIRGKPIRSGF